MKISPLCAYNHTLYSPNSVQDRDLKVENKLCTENFELPDIRLQQVYFCSKINVEDEKNRLDRVLNEAYYPFEKNVLFKINKNKDTREWFLKRFDKFTKENGISPKEVMQYTRFIEDFGQSIFDEKGVLIPFDNIKSLKTYAKYHGMTELLQSGKLYSLCKFSDDSFYELETKALNNVIQMQKEAISKGIDPDLINDFKIAIQSGNYDLKNVYKEHYKPLESMKTVKEVREVFPSIIIPDNTRVNVAKRLISCMDTEFYEKFDKFITDNDNDNMDRYAEKNFDDLYVLCQKYMTKEQYNLYLHDTFINSLVEVLVNNKKHNEKIPTINPSQFTITPEEQDLITLDFNEYVLKVLQAMYLEDYDLKSLYCQNAEGKSICPAKIRTPQYKFQQSPSNIINKIFKIAEKIQRGERDYDNFDEKQLRSRLEYFENSLIDINDKVLECIMKFEYAKVLPEDYKTFKEFLRELDLLKDEKQSADEFLNHVKQRDLTPKGQERLNKLEREKLEREIQKRRQYEEQLQELQQIYRDNIFKLNQNNLIKTAAILKSYYPQNLEDKKLLEIINIINSYTDENNQITNPEELNESIICLDKYYRYQALNDNIFKIATDYAKNNKIKAGQYLKNFENIINYQKRENNIDYFDKDLLQTVIQKCCENDIARLDDFETIKTATYYLCKYEDYNKNMMNSKNVLNEFIEFFDENDEIDCAVLKYLITEKYIDNDTEIIFKNNTSQIPVIFTKKAKSEIYKRYKYPKCTDYFTAFEHAMTKSSNSTGSSGIKQIGSNNDKIRGLEVKISIDKDRLFSSRNDYIFDTYDYYGLHN